VSIAVVIPFHKEPDWSLFENLSSDVHIYAVDDSPEDQHEMHTFPKQKFADVCWLRSFPKYGVRSSASRNIGHREAYADNHDIIMALDSDCRPDETFVEWHTERLGKAPTLGHSSSTGWLSTTHHIDAKWPRGYPYEARDGDPQLVVLEHEKRTIKLNMGIWNGVLDMNAIDRLQHEPPPAVTPWNYTALSMFPICGMNVAFAAELLPAYFFLPDIEIDGWTMSRHDDIWGGYILKRLMDKKGDLASFGQPVVEHTVLSDRDRALVREHWMHLLARGFYACVDEAVTHVKVGSYQEMYAAFVPLFKAAVEVSREPRHYREAYLKLAAYMENWVAAFS